MTATIAAVSTAPGPAALAVIRISGPRAGAICDQLFKPNVAFPCPSEMAGYSLAYGGWYNPAGKLLDRVILAAFRAPHSYTGEDVYEVSLHGGSQVKRSILDSLFAAGARPAEPGEFSKRAFLHGKMDLSQAEAVMDLISAESYRQQDLALQEMQGSVARLVASLLAKVWELLAHLESILEFSEENAEAADYQFLHTGVRELQQQVSSVLATWSQGRILEESFQICLLGLVNAGKSSLLNTLMREDRAIVSAQAGTTRDTLEARIQLAGLPVVITDTAGLRDTEDQIEQAGVERAIRAAAKSDLILWLHDPENLALSLAAYDRLPTSLQTDKQVYHLLGKQDLPRADRAQQFAQLQTRFGAQRVLGWSIHDASFLTALETVILDTYRGFGSQETGGLLLHNVRHKHLFEQASQILLLTEQSLSYPGALDATSALLRQLAETLAGIQGNAVSDQLVDEIFARFCVGK